jgi:hypothetical protein
MLAVTFSDLPDTDVPSSYITDVYNESWSEDDAFTSSLMLDLSYAVVGIVIAIVFKCHD